MLTSKTTEEKLAKERTPAWSPINSYNQPQNGADKKLSRYRNLSLQWPFLIQFPLEKVQVAWSWGNYENYPITEASLYKEQAMKATALFSFSSLKVAKQIESTH